MTAFLGVSFGAIADRIVSVATSDGTAITDLLGLRTFEIVAFLWSLQLARTDRAVVGFDFASDLELVFRDLASTDKDVLFGLRQKQHNRVEKDNPLYDWQAALRPGVIKVSARYRVSALPGKLLRIANLKQSGYSLHDISGYFEGCDLIDALEYLPQARRPQFERIEKNLMSLWSAGIAEALVGRCIKEAEVVALLASKIADVIEPLELNSRQWYGPSAIASRCLNKWGARRQAKRLNEKNSVSELLKAIDCAYFGGRVEAIKLGTIEDIRTYDLNSAYAYATVMLSQFYSPLRFTRKYDAGAPFSCWLVDYQLPDDTEIGVLPTRNAKGGISFRTRGRGYFWQPEVDYLIQRYPQSYKVRWGYVAPYEPVTFGKEIEQMYQYRLKLKSEDNKGEKIIKLALSNLYGKFAQNTGSAYYQCRAWAGWITAFVRRLLLEAVTGVESQVICFAQDAVHFQGDYGFQPPISEQAIGEQLGQWKTARYSQGFYVSPGIYSLTELGAPAKNAACGANLELDYTRIANELSSRQSSELSRAFFVGWQLSQAAPLKYQNSYLKEVSETLALIPSRLRARNYRSEFDWLTENRTSEINSRWSGQLSSRYLPQDTTLALRLRLKDQGWV